MESNGFRKMRRSRQQLPSEESLSILSRMSSGVLAVHGDNGYPYTVPLSFVYENGKIYFHSAVSGHKIESVRKDDKVSFCVIEQDNIVPEKFTTYYRSVIVFGKIRFVEDNEEKLHALDLLADKYSPQISREARELEIRKDFGRVCILELSIEHVAGKQAIELMSK